MSFFISNHSSNCLPTLRQEEIASKAIEPKVVARDLGFQDLLNQDERTIDKIRDADAKLLDNGYTFIGYHGTNRKNLTSMFSEGLNPIYCGSGDGQAKGSGFYIARTPEKANDYADSSTQSGDPLPPKYETPRYTGDQGQMELLRVYAKNFDGFTPGKDFSWGIESSDGDLNGDKKPKETDTQEYGLGINKNSLEMVISPSKFPNLAVLPSLYGTEQENLLSSMQKWPSHHV